MFDMGGKASVVVTSIDGRCVYANRLGQGMHNVDFAQRKGVYTIMVERAGSQRFTGRIVIR